MRIKFIEHPDYDCDCIGDEWQGELEAKGSTIVAGHRIAGNGILYPFVEDITEYTTDKDGNVVEVVPEPMEADK
jgi:hypothetical protein